jgi:hypothetical protein
MGITRHEFLYDITFWEAMRIIRGYRNRNRLLHQLLAENVYSTIYMMRDSKGKKPEDLFPQIFESDDDEDEESDPISEEDRQQLLADMAAWQQQLDEQRSDED